MADRKDEAQLARGCSSATGMCSEMKRGVLYWRYSFDVRPLCSNPIGKIQVAEHNLAVTIARMAGTMDGLYAELGIREE